MLRKKNLISGEIFKEPLLDIFLTDLEQISFSLLAPRPAGCATLGQWLPRNPKTEGVREHSAGHGAPSVTVSSARLGRLRQTENTLTTGFAQAGTHKSKAFVSAEAKQPKMVQPSRDDGRYAQQQGLLGQPETLWPERSSGLPRRGLKNGFFPFDEKANTQQITLNIKIGDYVHCGDKIGEFLGTPLIIGDSGRVITLTKTQLTLQRTQPVLFYSEATSHVRENEWVQRGSPILTLTHQTLVTGDIVQGIPRIEQLFEAVTSSSSALPDDQPLYETLHSQAREIFRKNWSLVPLPTAVRQALEEIQQIIVESIQKVYLSQGVLIADKHIEIIVKQMTSKGQIIDNGDTGFIINEVLPLQKIENANLTTSGKKAVYAPAVVGLTRAALNSDSFVSAASFQETTRVLTRDAVAGKSDFLRGLKEKVVIGDLISAGTGLDLFFLYTLLAENIFDPTCEKMSGLRKPRPNKYESSLRKI